MGSWVGGQVGGVGRLMCVCVEQSARGCLHVCVCIRMYCVMIRQGVFEKERKRVRVKINNKNENHRSECIS